MIYFNLTGEHENNENFRVNVSFEGEHIDQVLENLELFLRGLGYNFGKLYVNSDIDVTSSD